MIDIKKPENSNKDIGEVIGCKKRDFENLLRSAWMSTMSFSDEYEYIMKYYDDESLVKEMKIYNKTNNQMALNLSMRLGNKNWFDKILKNCDEPVDLIYLTPGNSSSFYNDDLTLEVAKILMDKNRNHVFNFKLKDKKFFINSAVANWDLSEYGRPDKFYDLLDTLKIKKNNRNVEVKVLMKMDFDFLLDFFEKKKYTLVEQSETIKNFFQLYDEDNFSGFIKESLINFKNCCESYIKKIELEANIGQSENAVARKIKI